MNITGHTRVFMILGDPIAQVRAPEIFNHLFQQHGIDAVLIPAHVDATHLQDFVHQALATHNVDGLLLSIPHKASAVSLLTHCDALGRSAGAVNAIRKEPNGELTGALFDGVGFVKSLLHFGIALDAHQRVMLVGLGGGGIAIAVSLAAHGVRRFALFDTVNDRARDAAARLERSFDVEVDVLSLPDPTGCQLVVNATPLGLKASDPMPFDVNQLSPDATVMDILMTRLPTPLLQACAARGITAYPGYEMLLQQVPNYLRFFKLHDLADKVEQDSAGIQALMYSV